MEEQKHWELDGVERGVRRVREEIDGQKVADSKLGSALAQRAVPRLIHELEPRPADNRASGLGTLSLRGANPWHTIGTERNFVTSDLV